MAEPLLQSRPSERFQTLRHLLTANSGFADALDALSQRRHVNFDGVWGAACALLAAALVDRCPGTLVVVCPRQSDADDFCDDLDLFAQTRIERFPAWESNPGERVLHDDVYGERLRTLKRIAGDDPPKVVVTSIQSLLQPVPSPELVAQQTRIIATGQTIDVEQMLAWLAEHKFHNTTAVELPGEFSIRGGIVDIFAPDWYQPVRIELFGDEVESIRRFDVSSQRSLETLDQVEVTLIELGLDNHAHLADHLPDDAWFLISELAEAEKEGRYYLKLLERATGFHTVNGVLKKVATFPVAFAAGMNAGDTGDVCHLQIESVERFSGDISRVRDELDTVGEGHEVYVVARTDAEVERLSEILGTTNVAAAGRLHFPVGALRGGFRLLAEKIIVISGNELFKRGDVRRLARRHLGKAIDSFFDLREGDLVVHLSHGIGRYRGMELLSKDHHVEEHLKIEFHGKVQVYVPASKIGLVQKYVGTSRSRPSLARIGGKAWVRQKKAAEQAVTDMASDMLELQASRESRPGIPFVQGTDWQREFDASFPYEETPDQLTAIKAIGTDMSTARPMDRLLCGDVGFGKTELAMRAAFRAVDNGYQVAVLVPTTILAEQHYRTFRERMAEFPFDIARLSRFCSTAEERDIVERLGLGQVDIVVGTHRLASKDVKFFNLGLVVIDEEQRFGVEVKERLKTLRATVDIMTMSATPIPRTLHMSLVGIRDISNLETPPEDRVGVETRVTRFDPELIRHAVLRELNRGGQIYFVHNRVGDIEVLADRLRYIVPEASIRIGHGQMPEGQLEKVMVGFVNHEFDILLATTIVESGLDIPNANTIFIDEAHRYGLADLHQLRGRVGRYKHRAYCYLLIDSQRSITPNAARRLRAIEEFSDMGAGFAIAMRDLEIRGAGNLLGTQQSGHIAAVGYELYCQLLEAAVRKLKQMPPKLTVEADVDLPGEAWLPDDYVPDIRAKIDLYRRMTRVSSVDELAGLVSELNDRFGKPPTPVERMLAIAELKIDAAVWQISAIHVEGDYLVFVYANKSRIEQLKRLTGNRLRVVDDTKAYLPLKQFTPAQRKDLLGLAKSVLQPQ